MAITQAMCTSFKTELLLGVHRFAPTGASAASTFKLALYSSGATLSAGTTAFVAGGEVVGTNYTSAGSALTILGVSAGTTSGFVDISDLTFNNVSIAADGALIYNRTPLSSNNAGSTITNAAVCVLDFGGTKTASAGDFTIVFPAATSAAAIIRIA
tara:strand:- start:90 stop:557 length:468 start_codon:yes stop_codon:yes gene_type:complete